MAITLKYKSLLECHEQTIKDLKRNEQAVERLTKKNKLLSSKLITHQEDTQGQAIFLDALENLLLDHGFKVVSIHD